jgi:D-glycero-alpha-D-manno-heptose-7-phosphate kinase
VVKYRARAPLRIDFAGGWTDIPIFTESEEEGGAVLNAAIDRYASGYIIRPPEAPGMLAKALGSKTCLRYEVDAPAGAGLGASAAQTLLWLTLVKTTIANVSERRELAERAWRVEQELGILGGKQDHYASAIGGINFMTFGKETCVEPLSLKFPFIENFERRLVLVYTGRKRLSSDIHQAVWEGYRQGDPGVMTALRNLRRLAYELRDALLQHDLSACGQIMQENWANQKALHSSITNASIEYLMDRALHAGAIGGKACGAGGGGCLLFLAQDGAELTLTKSLAYAGAQPLPFHFDWYGVHLTKG